ncbi:MAG: transglycosylase SLT domain-containing protein [Bacteroidota bacterium]
MFKQALAYIPTPSPQLAKLLIPTALLITSACSVDEPTPDRDQLEVNVVEPVERDWQDIKQSGVLRMITSYSSSSYFLHQGVERGFEYEMMQRFAHQHDLALDVVILKRDDNPYDILNRGDGDVIADNYTITPERNQYVTFTRPYNLVNQIVVLSDQVDPLPQTLEELQGTPISVRRNSSYYFRLIEMEQKYGYDFDINLVPDDMDTEALLTRVQRGEYLATIADNNMYQAVNKYLGSLVEGPTIARNDTIAWAIRKNASDLETEMNRFLYQHFRFGEPDERPKRSAFLNVLRKRYFQESPQIQYFYASQERYESTGSISPYDGLIKTVADSANMDWLLITAIIAQESKFNPESTSWAGAVGLMQILPRFSEVSNKEKLFDPEINIREGVRIMSEHLDHYSYLDSTNQWKFALASYNVGQGHVADARRLAIDANKNPNEWENIEDALLKLMQRKYYSRARYGFCRGIETVRYVRGIMNRYQTYKAIMSLAEQDSESNQGVLGIKTFAPNLPSPLPPPR